MRKLLAVMLCLTSVAHAQTPESNQIRRFIEEGQVQCNGPQESDRTCESMATYRFVADGSLTYDYSALLSGTDIVRNGTALATLDGNKICGVISGAEARDSSFERNGAPVPDNVRQQIVSALERLPETHICTQYTADNGQFAGTVYVNGTARPELAQNSIWLRDTQGWIVGQRP